MNIKNKYSNRARAVISSIAISSLALGGFAIGDFGTQTAQASDNKIMPGHACLPETDGSDTNLVNLRFLRSKVAQWYKCPIVRDDTNGELDFVRIRTRNSTTDAVDPQCRVSAVSPLGGAISNTPWETASAAGDDTLKFAMNGFSEFDHGHYVIECLLGTNDRIYSYCINED